MMGDYEDIGDDLVDTDSFVNHRGAGEEPFYVPEENDSDSSAEDNDVALDWSQEDLSAIMDELELMDDYSDDEQKDYDLIHWNLPEVRLVSSEESEEEGTEDSDLGEMRGNNSNGPEWYEYPYGQDFVEDFHCLQNSSYDVRNDLLDMLEITERSCSRSHSDTEVNSYSLHHEVQEAINDILIPGMSREEENSGHSNLFFSFGHKLLSWFCDMVKGMNIRGGYEDILRQLTPLMRTNDKVQFIR
ncbi:uncharacterized protein [Halyomorpha halys]|uniref:uncharacterized protein isoform X7 n=1 Tax=Halyomorpha halys TaxID=286706 RepID=UPI0034D31F37